MKKQTVYGCKYENGLWGWSNKKDWDPDIIDTHTAVLVRVKKIARKKRAVK